MKTNGSDPVAAAVEAVDKPVQRMRQITVTISSTGRNMVVAYPEDLTEAELFEFVGWASNNLRVAIGQERVKSAAGLILVPAGRVHAGRQ